jgi:hypothetical protein
MKSQSIGEISMRIRNVFVRVLCLVALCASFSGMALAQTPEPSIYTFSGDTAIVSKYIWRGQRLTNDWSLQPAVTIGAKGFSFNAWGTVDLTAVNEGNALLLPENPLAGSGASGLKGKFSEVDYTFSYANSYQRASFNVGTIIYTFPERSATLASTTEIYGGVSFDAPLAPSATLYIDVDQTTANGGDRGLYFLLGAGHTFALNNANFTGLGLSSTLAFANNGFSSWYYGGSESGAHDFSLKASLPITLGKGWTVTPYATYSALLGGFRDLQFRDPREVYRGTAGAPDTYADTVWGGFNFNLSF